MTNSRTVVGAGVCGSTSVATNLTCYLETPDGVINASADGGDTPLVALVGVVVALLGPYAILTSGKREHLVAHRSVGFAGLAARDFSRTTSPGR